MTLRLPKALWSSLGPLPVSQVAPGEMADGAMGTFTFRPRTIHLDKTMSPESKAQTFWHEAVHVALWDSGVHNHLGHELQESVCDALGSYLAGMMKAGCLTVRAPKTD